MVWAANFAEDNIVSFEMKKQQKWIKSATSIYTILLLKQTCTIALYKLKKRHIIETTNESFLDPSNIIIWKIFFSVYLFIVCNGYYLNCFMQTNETNQGFRFYSKNSNKRERTSACCILWCAQTKPFKLGHFHDDDIWLQIAEFISVLLSYFYLHVNLPIPLRFQKQ